MGRPGGASGRPPSGPLLPLPLLLLLGLPPPLGGAPVPSVQHTYESVRHLQVSMNPTASVQISAEGVDTDKSSELSSEDKEEETLNDLVSLLQDFVNNVPTEQAQVPTESPTAFVAISYTKPSPSETVDTVWKSVKPKKDGVQGEVSQAVESTTEATPTTTAIWRLRDDASISVVLHSDVTTEGNTTPESQQHHISASVAVYSATPTPEEPLLSVSPLMENKNTAAPKSKSFDQLTNGALANLVESLKNVKKLHLGLQKSTSKPQQESRKEKPPEAPQHKPSGADILDLIDTLIKAIKNAPSAVKEDPALHSYIGKAEGFLKEALELPAEAEDKLAKDVGQEQTTAEAAPTPSPLATVSVVSVHVSPSPSSPLAKKAQDTQVGMGKLKAFINLLYGFSPLLTSYVENSPNKKAAEDIVDRAMAVLDAIKSVFCGNPEGRSKQMLKELLKKDMELVKQAMKEE